MKGLIDLKAHKKVLDEVEIQREALKKARIAALQIVPKLPKVSKGKTGLKIFTDVSYRGDDPNRPSEPMGVIASHSEPDGCGHDREVSLKYYFRDENSAKDLRDCLCKLLGTPTEEDLKSVTVEMV